MKDDAALLGGINDSDLYIHSPAYGLTSYFIHDYGQVQIKLGCYDISYDKGLDDHFEFPAGIMIDDHCSPLVQVPGFIKTNHFPVS